MEALTTQPRLRAQRLPISTNRAVARHLRESSPTSTSRPCSRDADFGPTHHPMRVRTNRSISGGIYLAPRLHLKHGVGDMQVTINSERCQGHAMCRLACPEVFTLSDEDGHASALRGPIPTPLEMGVRQAQRSCPEGAIEIAE
jgi:ferredoxin